MFKKFEWQILIKVLLMSAALFAVAYVIIKAQWVFLVIFAPVVIYQLVDFYKFQKKAHDELAQFVESVHYRDFSRYFDVKQAPPDLQPLREGFNEINDTFKVISKERETQYQYLQKILELVNTGILSYEEEGQGTVIWMNESLKRMLQVPYLKTVYSLARRDKELYESLLTLKPGEGKIATAHVENTTFKILLAATTFQTDGRKYKLVAFQNVNEALDETESKAWQKLLSVMTHEIMNSVAPISSLADTLGKHVRFAIQNPTEKGSLEDVELGIETIRRRSEGLLSFAETYRNLNKITTLNLTRVHVRDLFANLYQLMRPTLLQKEIDLETILKERELSLELDLNLVEQVLINLLVNAIDAVKNAEIPTITLSAATVGNRVMIKIGDNGGGIPEDLLEQIFVPFFTTKKSGSGIGLSLCKQIMLLHHGSIKVQSVVGQGSEFILYFPLG